jgi:hypothetical protein
VSGVELGLQEGSDINVVSTLLFVLFCSFHKIVNSCFSGSQWTVSGVELGLQDGSNINVVSTLLFVLLIS